MARDIAYLVAGGVLAAIHILAGAVAVLVAAGPGRQLTDYERAELGLVTVPPIVAERCVRWSF